MINRREWIGNSAAGLSGIALAWMLRQEGLLAGDLASSSRGAYPTLTEPKAKRAIHIFSPGGVSHVDTFDYKPELVKQHGKPLTGKGELDPFFGKPGNLLKNLWEFHRRGESGLWVSELLPHLATCVDDLTFLYTLTSKSSSHTPACFQMNTGFTRNGYPCVGSWLSYGLGTENEELPTFVVLPDHRGHPNGGSNNWSQGFL
ncbi:MAG: DUF1501 domain-containing protein, partial [Planctomycetota bacterium]|nr:DUF1501 domain-containing protein [Planctomycetota bacterium]